MKINLKFNNKYFCAELGGGVAGPGSLVCNRDVPLSWEQINEEPADDGVSLRVNNGCYISAELDDSISTNRTSRGLWEKWYKINNGYKSVHGKFMSVHPDTLVYADKLSQGATEIFQRIELTANSGEHGQLITVNRDFQDENGEKWQMIAYHMHYLINKMFDGSDIDSILDEPIELGFNTIMSFGMHASPWKTANGWRCTPIEHPDYYVKLAELFDRCASRRIRICHAPLVDMQHLPSSFNKQHFFQMSCGVMSGRWNVLASKGNEQDHNGWHQNDYQFPGMNGVLCTQGTIGEDKPPRLPYLHWCVHSLRRDLPKMFVDAPLRQVMDGDFNQENGQRGVPTNRPTVSIEPIFFNNTNPDHVGDGRSTDPRVALELGLLTGVCAGGGFGASEGLECRPLGPIARACAQEYVRGMKSSFKRPLAGLDFQGDH